MTKRNSFFGFLLIIFLTFGFANAQENKAVYEFPINWEGFPSGEINLSYLLEKPAGENSVWYLIEKR